MAACGDHARNFYLWGAMGGAVMIGLGLALAQPALPVLVITGDGEMLMGWEASPLSACSSPAISASWCWTTRSMAKPAARRATPLSMSISRRRPRLRPQGARSLRRLLISRNSQPACRT